MGYLAKHSPKKCMAFILGGTTLEIIKTIIDKLNSILDKINNYLQWIDMSIELPEWMTYTMNTIAFVCIVLGIVFFFSKKKVVEISFMDKRICIPQRSITKNEFNMLYQSINNAKKMI